jgi:hypothetical protein
MDYETRFPARLIDEAELADLVLRFAKVTDNIVDCQTVYIVSTDDAEFSSVLDTLAERMIRKDTPKKPLEGRKRKPRRKFPKPTAEKRLGLHSYRNETTGEIVSKQWINKRLAANELERGARFVNGHDDVFMVGTVDDDPSAPMQLIIVGEQA